MSFIAGHKFPFKNVDFYGIMHNAHSPFNISIVKIIDFAFGIMPFDR